MAISSICKFYKSIFFNFIALTRIIQKYVAPKYQIENAKTNRKNDSWNLINPELFIWILKRLVTCYNFLTCEKINLIDYAAFYCKNIHCISDCVFVSVRGIAPLYIQEKPQRWMCHIQSSRYPTPRNTWGYHFWCRKVFEGVQNHVLDLLRKHNFGAEHFFDYAPKLSIRTIVNAPKLRIDTWLLLFSSMLPFWCIFLFEINDHVLNFNFGAFEMVRMRTFGA